MLYHRTVGKLGFGPHDVNKQQSTEKASVSNRTLMFVTMTTVRRSAVHCTVYEILHFL